jgi:hypothetical protein
MHWMRNIELQKYEGKKPLGKIMLKSIQKKSDGPRLSALRRGSKARSCEYNNNSSDSTKGEQFLDPAEVLLASEEWPGLCN